MGLPPVHPRIRARSHAAQILSAQSKLRKMGAPVNMKGSSFGCRNSKGITPKARLAPRRSMDPPRTMATAARDRFQFRIYHLSMKYSARMAKTAQVARTAKVQEISVRSVWLPNCRFSWSR